MTSTLSSRLITTLLTCFLATQASAQGGSAGGGNGGGLLVCENENGEILKVKSYDLWSGKEEYQLPIQIETTEGYAQMSPIERFDAAQAIAEEKLSLLDQFDSAFYLTLVQPIFDQVSKVIRKEYIRVLDEDLHVGNKDYSLDVDYLPGKSYCESLGAPAIRPRLITAIIYRDGNQDTLDKYDSRTPKTKDRAIVDAQTMALADTSTDLAALLVHEVIFKILRRYADASTSYSTRRYVSLLFTNLNVRESNQKFFDVEMHKILPREETIILSLNEKITNLVDEVEMRAILDGSYFQKGRRVTYPSFQLTHNTAGTLFEAVRARNAVLVKLLVREYQAPINAVVKIRDNGLFGDSRYSLLDYAEGVYRKGRPHIEFSGFFYTPRTCKGSSISGAEMIQLLKDLGAE